MEEYLTILQNYFKEIKDFGNKNGIVVV